MKREEVLQYLNNRLKKTNASGPLTFDDNDVNFIRIVIHHYKKKLISLETIVHSFNSHDPMKILYHIDFMITKLVSDFKINLKTRKESVSDPQLNLSMGLHPFATQEVELIEEYY